MQKARLTVLGSFVVDLTARTPHLPVTGETVKGSTFRTGPGGKGSNQAVAAQRAGAEVTMIAKIGKDAFGKIALDNFRNENIDSRYIYEDDNHETGAALIMVDENSSDNKIVVVLGANEHITDENIENSREGVENAGLLLMQLEISIDALEKAVEIAYNKGVRIILNPAPARKISDDLLNKIEIITPNEIEASVLSGVFIKDNEDVKKAARIFFKKGVKYVVITLGNKGVYAGTKEKEMFIPAVPVQPVDTTGAGDAFNGAFATALAEGRDFFEAVEFGNIAGALSVTRMGTAPAMPYRNEIESYITSKSKDHVSIK